MRYGGMVGAQQGLSIRVALLAPCAVGAAPWGKYARAVPQPAEGFWLVEREPALDAVAEQAEGGLRPRRPGQGARRATLASSRRQASYQLQSCVGITRTSA